MRDSAYLLDVLIDCCNDITGLETVKSCLIVPTATGETSLHMSAIRVSRACTRQSVYDTVLSISYRNGACISVKFN